MAIAREEQKKIHLAIVENISPLTPTLRLCVKKRGKITIRLSLQEHLRINWFINKWKEFYFIYWFLFFFTDSY